MRSAIKNKVGGDMHESQIAPGTQRTQYGGSIGVHGIS